MSAQLRFKQLSLRNFLSFGNSTTEIDLSYMGSSLIQGENIDTGGANGVGKCVSHDTPINIKNKKTGEIFTMTIGEFYEMQVRNQAGKNM
jgi:hypothetical protein